MNNYLTVNNLIRKPKNYKFPSDKKIKFILEEYGYDGYIPKTLLYQLLVCCTNNTLIYNKSKVVSEFDELNIELLKTIPFYFYDGSPLEKAIQILIDLSGGINFRSFEAKMPFIIENINNKKDILEDQEENLQNTIICNFNHKQVALENILKYLKFLDSELNGLSNKQIKFKHVASYKKLNNYAELLKINSTKFNNPLFKYNLVKKNFIINKYSKIKTEKDKKIVLIIDVSASMVNFYTEVFSVLYYLYKKDLTLDIYLINSKNTVEYKDVTPEILYNEILNSLVFSNGMFDNFTKTINNILDKYEKSPDTCLIITDGAENILIDKPKSEFIIINTDEENESLKKLATKYITL